MLLVNWSPDGIHLRLKLRAALSRLRSILYTIKGAPVPATVEKLDFRQLVCRISLQHLTLRRSTDN